MERLKMALLTVWAVGLTFALAAVLAYAVFVLYRRSLYPVTVGGCPLSFLAHGACSQQARLWRLSR